MRKDQTIRSSSDLLKPDLLSEVLLAGSGVAVFLPWLLIVVAALAKLPR